MSSRLVSASLVLTLAVAGLTATATSAQPNWEDLLVRAAVEGKIDENLEWEAWKAYDSGEPDRYIPVIISLYGPLRPWLRDVLVNQHDVVILWNYSYVPALSAAIKASEVADVADYDWVREIRLDAVIYYENGSPVAISDMLSEIEGLGLQVSDLQAQLSDCRQNLSDARDQIVDLFFDFQNNLSEKNAQIEYLQYQLYVNKLARNILAALFAATIVGATIGAFRGKRGKEEEQGSE